MSYRKAHKARQKPHRERGQVSERKELGLLEKKKDYKLRAKNYQEHQKKLKALRKKAQARNPDEFYFNMVNNKLEDGVFWIDSLSSKKTTPAEQEHLLETQDTNYVNWKLQIERKKVQKIEETLKLSEPAPMKNKHTYFVDSADEIPKKEALTNKSKIQLKSTTRMEMRKELKGRRNRVKELRSVSEKMTLQKFLSNDKDGSKELVLEEGRNRSAIYKWKPMRKK